MNDTWVGVIIGGTIGVLGTLFGAIVNGFFTRSNTRLQLESQEKREERNLKLLKLEELHELMSLYTSSSGKYASEIRLMSNEKTEVEFNVDELKKYQELFIENLIEPLKKIRAIVGIHIPECRIDMLKIRELNENLRDLGTKFLLKEGNYNNILEKQKNLVEKCRVLQKKLEDISDKLIDDRTNY